MMMDGKGNEEQNGIGERETRNGEPVVSCIRCFSVRVTITVSGARFTVTLITVRS